MLSRSFLAGSLLACVTSKLVVYSPSELISIFSSQDGVIQANYANFGHIPYGQSLIGTITYDLKNPTGCDKYTTTEDDASMTDSTETKKSVIMLVDRGNCSFV